MVVDTTPFMGVMFGPPGITAEGVRPMADQMRAQILADPSGSSRNLIEQMIPAMTRTETMRSVLLQYHATATVRQSPIAFHEGLVTDLRFELPRITAPITVLYVIFHRTHRFRPSSSKAPCGCPSRTRQARVW